MRALFVADPVGKWKVDRDTTPLMLRELWRRHGEAWLCTVAELSLRDGEPRAWARPVSPGLCGASLELGSAQNLVMADFDVVHMRTDPPFDMNYYLATQVLELASAHTLVVNDPLALRNLNEKLLILRFGAHAPESLVSADVDAISNFVAEVGGRAVLKPLYRCSGQGVILLESGTELQTALPRVLDDNRGHVMVQRFLPGVTRGELRAMVIDGRVAGCMLKVPRPGAFLSNLDAGASVQACELTPPERALLEEVGTWLAAHGVLFAAVDLIDGLLSEINITSPGLLHEMNVLNGTQLEIELQDAVERHQRCHFRHLGARLRSAS
ncbi:MAG: hypothetical protein ABIJ09_08395 [Pseudomonadota bacterium]